MKHILLFGVGIAGLVVAVQALHVGSNKPEQRIEYYASGQVQSECTAHAGVRDGECKRYWPNGRLQAQGQYEDGAMSGAWSFWNEDGTPDSERSGNYSGGNLASR